MARTAPAPSSTWSNWSGNQQVRPVHIATPASTDELSALLQHAAAEGRRVKPVGSGHSFTSAAVADDIQVDMSGMSRILSVDRAARLVTTQAGAQLCALNDALAGHGLALPNLGDVDVQTISGAISTGTHGTGAGLGCLSTFVERLTLVTAAGEVLHCSADRHPDVFAAARIGLGALGVITEVTLRCVDAFVLRAHETPARLADMLAGVDDRIAENDHFEFFWYPYTDRGQAKTNNRVPLDDAPLPRFRAWLDDEFLSNTVYGGLCRLGRAVPALVPGVHEIAARALTERTYTARSDRVFCTTRRVKFTEMEYAVPRAALPEALAALERILARLPFRVQFPVEVRFTAADDIWLSHGYGRDSAYLALHQFLGAPYEPYFRAFEQVATSLGGRPHWGKLHYRDADSLRPAYPRFDDFLAVRDRLDPDRLFQNAYTSQVLGD